MQRLREERMKEKLQGRQAAEGVDDQDIESPPPATFLPSPEKGELNTEKHWLCHSCHGYHVRCLYSLPSCSSAVWEIMG